MNKSIFRLSQLIDDCCEDVKMTGEYQIIKEGDLDLEVLADHDRIDQVITNFVNNAIKYAPQSKEIRITIKKENDFAKVSVIDRGRGIPPDKKPHLFERYFRVDTSGVQYSGLGLGLYINSEIIKRHGGQIGVNSDEGNGSTFWFTLPL